MTNEFAVCGAWREYDEVCYVPVETFATEDEAWDAVDRIENANQFNTMFKWYAVREV